jgi:hypothetical protein
MKKRLLILTGPQGSGNHLWSKVFSEDPSVRGWEQLTKSYWVGHGDEPFVDIWENPKLFSKINWDHDLYFTSISCPYITSGGPILPKDKPLCIPKYEEFIKEATLVGFEVILVVIGRDKNILEFQQSRVRKQFTLPTFIEVIETNLVNYNPFFVSTEQLYLYEKVYLNHVSKMLDWPINISHEKLKDVLKDNSNQKYLRSIDDHWLDKLMANTKNGGDDNPYKHNAKND